MLSVLKIFLLKHKVGIKLTKSLRWQYCLWQIGLAENKFNISLGLPKKKARILSEAEGCTNLSKPYVSEMIS